MTRTFALALLCVAGLHAETYTLTLREAVDMALRQNPEMVLARIEEQKAAQSIRLAKDPFYPKLVAGSGAAYSSGYPLTIDGSPPALLQTKAIQTFFNRTKSYQVAEARENARTSAIDLSMKRDDVAFRTASAYLDLERLTQVTDLAQREISDFAQVRAAVDALVKEGKLLDIEGDKAALNVAKATQRAQSLNYDLSYMERSLAIILGYGPDDVVKISSSSRTAPKLPESEQGAVDLALDNNKELRRLQSVLAAKGLEVKAQRASWMPQVDLVAQYALLTRYNYNEDFFRRFNRNAGEIGVSFTFPILSGTGASAAAATAEIESSRLREEMINTRGRISLEARRAFEELRNSESAEQVARMDLEVSRKQTSILLAQYGEGRALMKDVAQSRTVENEKWIALYDAQNAREKARLNVLKQTGSILSALR
jgi:outer membrane protein TolC